MVHPICRGLSKQNVIKPTFSTRHQNAARTSRFQKRSTQTTLPKLRSSGPGLEDRPLLLENPDNTLCYLNSALNILYMIKEVQEYLSRDQELENNAILKEIRQIFQKSQKSSKTLAELLNMGDGAQSCHEVLKKVVRQFPSTLRTTMYFNYQKLTCCKKCGESATPNKSISTVEVLLPEEGQLNLEELLAQNVKGACQRCNYPVTIFKDYRVTEDTKTVFISVLQAEPMGIRDLDTDAIWNFFGARWVLKGAVIYLPDTDPKIWYGENGHSISWTKHAGKWCKVSDDHMEVYDKFDATDLDIEMMIFERIERRN